MATTWYPLLLGLLLCLVTPPPACEGMATFPPHKLRTLAAQPQQVPSPVLNLPPAAPSPPRDSSSFGAIIKARNEALGNLTVLEITLDRTKQNSEDPADCAAGQPVLGTLFWAPLAPLPSIDFPEATVSRRCLIPQGSQVRCPVCDASMQISRACELPTPGARPPVCLLVPQMNVLLLLYYAACG